MRQFVGSRAGRDGVVFAAIVREPHDHIGNVNLGPVERQHNRAAIGIMLSEDCSRGQGFASEIVGAISTYAFKTLGIA